MFMVNLAAFYEACGVTPPLQDRLADAAGMVAIKDGTDFANLCRRSGVSPDAHVTLTFPDVSHEPRPPGDPIPIPYPNATFTAFNDQLRKGGFKKVKVLDPSKSSRFKTSAGDEAGAGSRQGVVSSKNTGKVYFQQWSMNVKVEGKNVITHLDMAPHLRK